MNFLAEMLFHSTETQDLDSIPCAISEGMPTLLEDDTDEPSTSFSFASANDSDISLNVSTNSEDVSSNQSISHAPTGSHAFNKVSSSCCSIPPYQLEYPVLGCGGEKPWVALDLAVRKRADNQKAMMNRVLQVQLGKSRKRKRAADDWESNREHRLMEIRHLAKRNDVDVIFQKYSQYCVHPIECIKEYAALVSQGYEEFRSNCSFRWSSFLSSLGVSFVEEGLEKGSYVVFQRLAEKVCSAGSKYVIVFDSNGCLLDIKDKSRQQPFIMCMGVPEFPGNCCLMINNQSYIPIGKVSCFECILMLFSVYFVFDYEYPTQASSLYRLLEFHVFGIGKRPTQKVYQNLFD
ncbi:uncharacterized protein LOC143444929 [Clavelina lepadiformis]|uniref:uncharacterized protein LOC143444929 n=1 Tax=Clavelina lepadiformis TaxID=159417 RepID=UPI004043220C